MPLHLHLRLSLPALADAAADVLRVPPPGNDPFAPDVLVVGGRGVEQWLRLALVQRLDIVTHLHVWSPSRLLQDLERWAVPSARSGAAALTVDILGAVVADRSLLPEELRHLGQADGGAVDGLLASWAGRMARTFERYQLYRADWLLAWERGSAPDDWQARLWRTVAQRSGAEQAPAERQQRATRVVAAGHRGSGPDQHTLAPRWLVVQQGRLSPAHLALLQSLSVRHEVHLLVHAANQSLLDALVAPAPDELSVRRQAVLSQQHSVTTRLDRARTDSLLAASSVMRSAATVTRESLLELDASPRSLLCTVQQLLRAPASAASVSAAAVSAAPAGPAPVSASPDPTAAESAAATMNPVPRWTADPSHDDASLRVLACHGALRQVEVLKDALLGAFNDDPSLQPRDVLILTPDPSRFVPLVQAVFLLAGDVRDAEARITEPRVGAPPLTLHVQGRSPRATNPVADVLLTLLTLSNERISASRTLELLEQAPVAERFALTSSDAPLVREWLHSAGVRWGIDADDPLRDGLGLRDEGTWRRGLSRLILGAAMLDSRAAPNTHLLGHAPVAGLEGERVLLAGRATRALRLVLALLEHARTPRPLSAWVEFADTVITQLIAPDGVYASSVPRVRDVLAMLTADAVVADGVNGQTRGTANTAQLTASALATLLESRLDDVLGSPGRLGGITVAPLATGWVRPARVIALLGMDDDAFPRRGGAPWFDRLGEQPELGDPDERGEQLQTVYESVLMAGERLLVTYTGWNRAGTMRLPPSIAIAALEEVVRDAVMPTAISAPEDAWRTWVQRDMPLQPFSARAFSARANVGATVAGAAVSDATRSAVPSFDVLAAATATQLRQVPSPRHRVAPPEAVTPPARHRHVLPLNSLLRFLRAPAEQILSRLGIRLEADQILLDDVLPISMSRLDESVAVGELAELLLLGGSIEPHLDMMRHRDQLPPARLGDAWTQAARQRAQRLAARGRAAVDGEPRCPHEVLHLSIGDTLLTGTVDRRHGDRLLIMRDSLCKTPRLISPFVTLCFGAAAGATVQNAVEVSRDATTTLSLPPDPRAVLETVIALYHDADRTVPPFAPATSCAYLGATRFGKSDEEARLVAHETWNPDNPSTPGECEYEANQLLHQRPPVDEPGFATLAEAVFGPMWDCMVSA